MCNKRFSFLNVIAVAFGILPILAMIQSGCAYSDWQLNNENIRPVEFHVKPDGGGPFSSNDPNVRPSLDKPGRPAWNSSGIEPEFWLSACGGEENPFATLFQAQLAVRELLRTKGMPAGGIKVIIHGGLYRLDESLVFVPGDSGTPHYPVIYEAAPGERPVFSGGVSVAGWKKLSDNVPGLPASAGENIWIAPAPMIGASALDFRQMYVNGKRAIRARTPNPQERYQLVHWDLANRQVLVDAKNTAPWQNLKGVEMMLQQSWVVSCLRLESMTVEDGKARITFQNPERNLAFSHPFPWARHNDPYYFVNALEFLDTAGEWYLDSKAGLVYYWPRAGEDMTIADVAVPRMETLIRFKGSLDNPVHDIQFKGLILEHSTWMRPSQMGLVPLQAGQYFEQVGYRIEGGIPEAPHLQNLAWTARSPAAVYLAAAARIGFEQCVFRNMASAALDFHYGTSNDSVVGCVFRDIGGNGIQIAKFSEDGLEAHQPYNPSDLRELCVNEHIANNYFRHCGSEDWGSVAVAAGYPRGLTIEHNEIVDVPYSGISLGWGWTPHPNAMRDNKILFNRIHRYMQHLEDGGAIYILSNQTPSEIRGNYIYDLYRPADGGNACMIYLDEGSAGFLVKDNRTENGVFFRNTNGPGNRWENTGPGQPLELKEIPGSGNAVGLEPRYRRLLKEQIAQEDLLPAEPPFNYQPVPVPAGTIYQTEDAVLSDGITVKANRDRYLGSGFVTLKSGQTGQSVAFKVKSPKKGIYPAVIRYANGAANPQTLSLYVNGQFKEKISFKNLANWNTWDDRPVDLVLKKGGNTITLKKDQGDGNITLDYLVIP